MSASQPALASTLAEGPASSGGGGQSADGAERLVGTVISDRYRVEALIGRGGMGAVYRVEHTLMRKRMALKVLHPEMSRNPEVVARFEREAMAAAHIEHPNVAAATDFGRLPDGAFFLVLEYVEGTSLGAALRAGPLAPPRAIAIARQIASALVRAHELGIVHRDLKPDNVMLVDRAGEHDVVKVLDFGIAKISDGVLAGGGAPGQALTRAGAIYGTPEYMAPEQALGEVVDARSDLYALGAITYEMMTGALPFDADDVTKLLGQIITGTVPPMSVRAPSQAIPPAIEAVVMRLLAKQPEGRYPSARDAVTALDDAAGASGFGPLMRTSRATMPGTVSVSAAGPALTLPGKLPPRLALAAAGGALVLLALVLAFTLGGGPRDGAAATSTAAQGLVQGKQEQQKGLSDAELERAVEAGPDALEKLATTYPDDPRIPRALARRYDAAHRTQDEMRAIGRLVAIEPSAANDPFVATSITSAANEGGEAADAAMALLEGPLGERGVDMLFEIATRPGANPLRKRATQSLAKPAVRAHASPAALVAIELRGAEGCEARKALLARARQHGDARALTLLRPLASTRGCGFLSLGDCYKCLRTDSALRDAIAAIDARSR